MVNREFPQEELVRAYLVNVESIVARGPKALDEVMSQRHHDFVYPKVVPNTFDMAGIRGLFAEEGKIHKVRLSSRTAREPMNHRLTRSGRSSGASQSPLQVVCSTQPKTALATDLGGSQANDRSCRLPTPDTAFSGLHHYGP